MPPLEKTMLVNVLPMLKQIIKMKSKSALDRNLLRPIMGNTRLCLRLLESNHSNHRIIWKHYYAREYCSVVPVNELHNKLAQHKWLEEVSNQLSTLFCVSHFGKINDHKLMTYELTSSVMP